MNDEPATQAKPESMGCLLKGCLTMLGLVVFLIIALAAGTFWGIHYLRGYSSTEAVSFQTLATAPIAQALPPDDPKQLERDWKNFEQAAARHEAVTIELSADDINALIASSEVKEQISVAIENNIGRLRFSVPLRGIFMMDGRYLNGTATVEASPDGDAAKARISNVIVNGQPVAESVLDQGLFGWPSIRTFVTDWLKKQRVASFRIEKNHVIGETRGEP